MAGVTAQAAREAGMSEVMECRDVAKAAAAVRELAREGDVILLKASRVSGLECLSEGPA